MFNVNLSTQNSIYIILNCSPNYVVLTSVMAARIVFRGNVFGVNEVLHLFTKVAGRWLEVRQRLWFRITFNQEK